jgi:myo-inositol 2-dehydrogenase/D-chiro-inositol 1-dehydrogenase
MKNPDAARIAFVGAGNHATQSLYPNLPQIPDFELAAVCDRVAERAECYARSYGAPRWFTEVEALLDGVQPQGVCIVGPAEMHEEVAHQVLRRGIPVFVEKPPAPSLAAAKALAAAAREHGAWGMVGFMKRFAPANLVAKEYLASEEFGRLSSIGVIHGAGPYQDARRMLYYNGIHLIDLLRFLGGEITEVSGCAFSDGANGQAVVANLRFAGGALGQFNCNSGRDWSDCFEQTYVSGSGASLLIDASQAVEVMAPGRSFARGQGLELFGWSGRYRVSGNMAGWSPSGHYTRGYWGELNHFAQAVLGRVAPTPNLDDGVEALRLIEAML